MEYQKNEGDPNAVYRTENHEHGTVEMEECIRNCLQCFQTCERMIEHCLTKGGVHANAQHIKILMDCAQICQTSAAFMLRNSNLHGVTCRACAEVCLACAEDCAQMNDDGMMDACIEVCRRCADSCQKMEMRH